jgi:hypothetical protein
MIDAWRQITAVAPAALREAALELHWAAQLIAAAGQTFVEERADDSHRSMRWHPGKRALVGVPFAGVYPFRVGVRPEDLTVVLLDASDGTLGALPLGGVTLDAAHEWLALGLATYLGSAPPEIRRPEYDMPAHVVGEGGPFAEGRDAERRAIARLYGTASSLLEDLASSRNDASTPICRPHHFDIATLITVDSEHEGDATRTIGVGLAPMGGGFESWYWYVTPRPYPDAAALPPLPGPGAWHTEGWTGAVLSSEMVASTPEAFRDPMVRKFLDVAVESARAVLGS